MVAGGLWVRAVTGTSQRNRSVGAWWLKRGQMACAKDKLDQVLWYRARTSVRLKLHTAIWIDKSRAAVQLQAVMDGLMRLRKAVVRTRGRVSNRRGQVRNGGGAEERFLSMVGWPKNEKGLKKMAAAEWYFSCCAGMST
jgi:hypothetical protein